MTKLSLPKSSALADLTDTQFRKFSIEVKQHTGVNMELHKKNLLSNRLKRRIKALNLTDYEEYYSLITGPQSKKELPFFIDEVTTHETYFYRGDKSWKYYTEQFLPKWKEAQGSTPLKIWCAVASTGEEPYTIAILSEEYKVKNKEFSYQIVASDISGAVIKNAKKHTIQDAVLKRCLSH